MSEVALETFIAFRTKSKGGEYVLHPPPASVEQGPNNRLIVTLGDVPLPKGVVHPGIGLTMYYGFKDALEEMSRQFRAADERGDEVRRIDVHVDVGNLLAGSLNKKTVHKTQFASLRRLSVDLEGLVLQRVNRAALRENPNHRPFQNTQAAGKRPDLICAAMRKEPFDHLRVIVYVVPDGTPRGRQMATLLSSDVASFQVLGDPLPFEVRLPKIKG